MAKELQAYTTSGLTLYAVLLNSVGQIWNTSGTPAFETYNGANWTDYDIALTEAGAGIYLGTMPAVVLGAYSYVVYEKAGAIPATTDTIKGSGWLAWDGSAEISAANANMAAVSGDKAAADNLEAMLDGTGGVDLDLKQLHLSNSAGPGLLIESTVVGQGAVYISNTETGCIGIQIDAVGLLSKAIDLSGEYIGARIYSTAENGYGLIVQGAGTGGTGLLASGTTPISGNITGNLSGSVGSLATQAKADVNAQVDLALADYDAPTKAELDAGLALLSTFDPSADVIEGAVTWVQGMRLMASLLGAQASGGGTTTISFRDLADTKDRVIMTVDSSGNRSAVVLDLT